LAAVPSFSPPLDAVDRRVAAEQAAARLPALLARAWRLAETIARGGHGRRRAGPGDAFWQYRPYEPGEAAHRIDWRRSGHGDGLFVRQRERETAQTVLLWRDASVSMDWSSHRNLPTKRDVAELLLLAAGCLLVRGGERVMLADAGGANGARGMGPAALERLATALHQQSGQEGADLPRPDGLPPRAEMIVCADFLMPWPMVEQRLRALRDAGLRCHLLQVLDPAEEDLPYHGRVRFDGVEESGTLLVPRVEALRAGYLERLAALQAALSGFARQSGWTFVTHRTDRTPTTALLALWGGLAGQPLAHPAPATVAERLS
jgi:uncharacterized protein (DUF58 family)